MQTTHNIVIYQTDGYKGYHIHILFQFAPLLIDRERIIERELQLIHKYSKHHIDHYVISTEMAERPTFTQNK